MAEESDPRHRWLTRLVEELGEYLQEPVLIVGPLEECFIEDAFCCFIRSSPPRGRAFQLCWEGVLGGQRIDDAKYDTSATLFLYSRNQRLSVPGHDNGSCLEVVYEGSLEHGGRWADAYWANDDLGEYFAYDSYSG